MLAIPLLLPLLLAIAPPKPVILQLENVLDGAFLIAEVRILEVEPADFGGAKAPGSVRVRVTGDPRRIVTGFAELGRELTLKPVAYGPGRCTGELVKLAGEERDVLMIVDQKKQVTLIGLPVAGTPARTYQLHGWCDFNALLLFSNDATLKRACGLEGMNEQVTAPGHALAARLAKRRSALLTITADRLLGVRPALSEAEFRAEVARLADDGQAGEAAFARLQRDGGGHVQDLERLLERSLREPTRTRLGLLVKSLRPHRLGADLASRCRRTGPGAEAAVLVEVMPKLDDARTVRATAHLRALASAAKPPLELGNDTDVVQAWRARLLPDTVGIAPRDGAPSADPVRKR